MSRRKRGHDEMEASETPKEPSLLEKLRNMWEFACLNQYIYTFGDAVKIDRDFDIEELETECLKPGPSEKLEEIGLTLLKWVSSHRGLTLEIWDEYTRRQYLSKAPERNPYGDEEQPKKFRGFDIFQKIRVLHQLSVWTFWNADRMREKMDVSENDQIKWRIDPIGFDRDLREYFVLDDNRLYRRTDPPLPPAAKAKPKANSLKAQAARRRASKRRRIEDSSTPEVKEENDKTLANGADQERLEAVPQNYDTFGRFKWELVAITVSQYQDFIASLKTRDPDEKELRQDLQEHVIPWVEKAEESQRRKIERKERELLNLQKLAGAKRSSRLADKQDRERQEREAAEAERKRIADLAAAHKEQERQRKMEEDRQSRMMTREQRIKDREYKRLLHEEELAKIEEEAKKVEAGEARGSERHLKAQMEKRKKDLEDLSAEEDWVFDCSGCGIYGKNVDDGAHSVACEKCSVWQHSKCLGITKAEAEKDDFHFICKDCKQRIEDAKKPKISLKFRTGLSSSPPQPKGEGRPLGQETFTGVEVPKKRGPGRPPGTTRPISQGSQSNGYTAPHHSQPASPNRLAYFQQPGVNGYDANATSQQSMPRPHHFPYANGYAQASPVANSPSAASPNGYNRVRPNPAPTQPGTFTPSSNNVLFSRPTSSHGPYAPYYNGVPYQYQNYSSQSPPPRPTPSHSPNIYPAYNSATQAVNNNANTAHIPSPMLNRPTMSPTQGNQGVGPGAGIPQKSPSTSYAPPLAQQRTPSIYQPNGPSTSFGPTTPASLSGSPRMNYLSGLSPTKHSPIIPPPTHAPHKSSMSPPPNGSGVLRSVSGTPVFPPAEILVPSPRQLSKSPVPTPSKSASPAQVGDADLRRSNAEAAATMSEPQQAGAVIGQQSG